MLRSNVRTALQFALVCLLCGAGCGDDAPGGEESDAGTADVAGDSSPDGGDDPEEEDPSDPLSDDRLAGLLRNRGGVSLARRTITKYRKVLAIPSSSQRRVF